MYTNAGDRIEGLVIGANNEVTSITVAQSTSTKSTFSNSPLPAAPLLELNPARLNRNSRLIMNPNPNMNINIITEQNPNLLLPFQCPLSPPLPQKRIKIQQNSHTLSNSVSVFEQDTERITEADMAMDTVMGMEKILTTDTSNNTPLVAVSSNNITQEIQNFGNNNNYVGSVTLTQNQTQPQTNTVSEEITPTKGGNDDCSESEKQAQIQSTDIGLETTTEESEPEQLPFDPEHFQLSKDFRLMTFSDYQGLKILKLPREEQVTLLSTGMSDYSRYDRDVITELDPDLETLKLKPGVDVSILALRRNLSLIKSMEVACPAVDDPFIAGQIACVILLSGLSALGISSIDNLLMTLFVSSRFKDTERDAVVPLMLKGFRHAAKEAGTSVTGGQTVLNPWVAIGGVATAVCSPTDYILPVDASVGDVLVLTKPLGTLEALIAHDMLTSQDEQWDKFRSLLSEEDVEKAYRMAVCSMKQHNYFAAKLMHKFEARGATEIGPYGLLGHAQKLAGHQKASVSFHFFNLPIIAKMEKVAAVSSCSNLNLNLSRVATGTGTGVGTGVGIGVRGKSPLGLLSGTSAEISGGLLIVLPQKSAPAFVKELERDQGSSAWIVGVVREGCGEKSGNSAVLAKNLRVLQVYCHGQTQAARIPISTIVKSDKTVKGGTGTGNSPSPSHKSDTGPDLPKVVVSEIDDKTPKAKTRKPRTRTKAKC